MEIRFLLNEKNEKDRFIIEVLKGEYSPSEIIKNILYKLGKQGNHPVVICKNSEDLPNDDTTLSYRKKEKIRDVNNNLERLEDSFLYSLFD